MHLSGPSRDVVSRDQQPVTLYPSRRVGRMIVIAIAGVGPQWVV